MTNEATSSHPYSSFVIRHSERGHVMDRDELARRRMRSGRELRERLCGAHREPERQDKVIGIDPRSAYELLTRQMVSDLQEELREMPRNDAEICPLNQPEAAHDTDANQLPDHWLQHQHNRTCQGVMRAKFTW